jgi:hypothetical protein
MPERIRTLFDRDTGTLSILGAGWLAARMAEVNLALQIIGAVFALVIMWPKVKKVFKDWKKE